MFTILTVSLFISSLSFSQARPRPSEGRPQVPTNPSVVKPAEPPPKKKLDDRRVEEITREAARVFADEVLDYVGRAYKLRYDLREGIIVEQNLGNFDINEVVVRSSTYREKYPIEAQQGKVDGYSLGKRTAQSWAYNLADKDINAAIDLAIQQKTPIVLVPNPRILPYQGSTPTMSFPKSILNYVLGQESTIHSSIRNLRGFNRNMSRDSFNQIFNISGIFAEDLTEIPRELRSDAGFENWRRDYFNTRGSQFAKEFYKEIGTPEYIEPRENEIIFRNSFITNYRRSIERPWRNLFESRSDEAYGLGRDIYEAAAISRATDLAKFDGYPSFFRQASLDGYNEDNGQFFLKTYNNSYKAIEEKLRVSSYLTQVDALVVTTNSSQQVALGDTFDIIVNSVTNRGMVDGTVVVESANGGSTTAENTPQSFTVPGVSRDSELKRFDQMARVTGMIAIDENISVVASVAGKSVSATFTSSFEEKIKRMSQKVGTDVSTRIFAFLLPEMKAQFTKINGLEDEFLKRNPDLYLVRLRALYPSLTSAEKAGLQTFKKQIRNAFPKPGWFSKDGGFAKINDWEEIMKMLKEMGL